MDNFIRNVSVAYNLSSSETVTSNINYNALYSEAFIEMNRLIELDKIHRHNLNYLWKISAKYSIDTPLKVTNEIDEEQAEIKKIQDRVIEIENKIKPFETSPEGVLIWNNINKWLQERKTEAAKLQLENYMDLLKIHNSNLVYLHSLRDRKRNISYYNAIKDEANQFVGVRRQIVKLDWHLKRFDNYRYQAAMNSGKDNGIGRENLLDELRNDKSFSRNKFILRIIGEAAFEQGILFLINWKLGIGFLSNRDTNHLIIQVAHYLEFQTDRSSRLLSIRRNRDGLFICAGTDFLKRNLEYYSVTPEMTSLEYDFNNNLELTYLRLSLKAALSVEESKKPEHKKWINKTLEADLLKKTLITTDVPLIETVIENGSSRNKGRQKSKQKTARKGNKKRPSKKR